MVTKTTLSSSVRCRIFNLLKKEKGRMKADKKGRMKADKKGQKRELNEMMESVSDLYSKLHSYLSSLTVLPNSRTNIADILERDSRLHVAKRASKAKFEEILEIDSKLSAEMIQFRNCLEEHQATHSKREQELQREYFLLKEEMADAGIGIDNSSLKEPVKDNKRQRDRECNNASPALPDNGMHIEPDNRIHIEEE